MVSLLRETKIQTQMKNLCMKLFENSPDLIIMIFYENLKIDFSNSFFLMSSNNVFKACFHILCILKIAPI